MAEARGGGRRLPTPGRAGEHPGRRYWRELSEAQCGPSAAPDEFAAGASEWPEGLDRRAFLRLTAASVSLAGLGACVRQPEETILPYVEAPEQIVPGRPLYFATALRHAGYGTGVLVESHMGRPTKVEGNPRHPSSLGATDPFGQAAVLGLYDPERSGSILHRGRIAGRDRLFAALRAAADAALEGAGFRVLTGAVTSPTLRSQLGQLLERFPAARWHRHEPCGRDASRAGAQLAFGRTADVVWHFERAAVVLSLEGDFLAGRPGSVAYARDFAARRRPAAEMSRVYAVEPTPSLVGAKADHRLPMRSDRIEAFARAVAHRLGVLDEGNGRGSGGAAPLSERERKWVEVVCADLERVPGASAVVPGDAQPAAVHALAYAINAHLGNIGTTLEPIRPIEDNDQALPLETLARDIENGEVQTLVILESNPVYTAPADLDFGELIDQVGLTVHASVDVDETALRCAWHVPSLHDLESWSDARGHDGTVTIMQPLIAPLRGGISTHEILGVLLGAEASAHQIVREHWRATEPADDFELWWRLALRAGVVPESRAAGVDVGVRRDLAAELPGRSHGDAEGIELLFRPHPTIWDGRYFTNGWLQELPDPFTKLTWDNAVLIAPALARELEIRNEDVVELRVGERTVRGPAWVLPGQAAESVTVHLGYGRGQTGSAGVTSGFDAYRLRTTGQSWSVAGVTLRKTGQQTKLATTQPHQRTDEREPIRDGTLREFLEDPALVLDREPVEHRSLYPGYEYPSYAWGMAIDLNSCVGCNACVLACQSENNIPVVGKEQVAIGREMQWLRVDTYFSGDVEDPYAAFQPVPCMHCEKAPCEPVCPVGATVHDSEGLNVMVYNRCVGTRYCSNNCPYKVRRFNFLQYSEESMESLAPGRNPDVTVRDRGVMEKCTYCIQRISAARREAKKEDRRIRDGEVRTACQQVCPAQAIVFGDLGDTESAVWRAKQHPLDYVLLEELNTRPRTSYTGLVRNPNPELEG